jgi:hypothetical protein
MARRLQPTFAQRLSSLGHAWCLMMIALYPAILLAGVGWIVITGSLTAEGRQTLAGAALVAVGIGVVLSIPLAFVFSLLALPFLMLRRFIVGPHAPYLRPGYLAVALYGPALLVLCGWRAEDWQLPALYEAIALTATAIYVRLDGPAESLGET